MCKTYVKRKLRLLETSVRKLEYGVRFFYSPFDGTSSSVPILHRTWDGLGSRAADPIVHVVASGLEESLRRNQKDVDRDSTGRSRPTSILIQRHTSVDRV